MATKRHHRKYSPKYQKKRKRKKQIKRVYKKQTQKRVETKTTEDEPSSYVLSNYSVQNPSHGQATNTTLVKCYNTMVQGISDTTMVGSNVMPKFLKTKLRFTFPQGRQQLCHGTVIKVIWGWARPYRWTRYSTPQTNQANLAAMVQELKNRLDSYLYQNHDFLHFLEKELKPYRVDGTRYIKIDRDDGIGQTANTERVNVNQPLVALANVVQGGPAPVEMTMKWKCPKSQIKYAVGAGGIHYNNDHSVPFYCIVNQGYLLQGAPIPGSGAADGSNPEMYGLINIEEASKFWFTDS